MVKEKADGSRLYDAEGYRLRAASIVCKDQTESEILLVTSSRFSDQWIIPGGGLEANEEYETCALRELVEEAGVHGKILRRLGVFENEAKKIRTMVYVMIATQELSEWEDSKNIGRQRKWFTIQDALDQLALHKPVQLDYLEEFKSRSKPNNGDVPTNGAALQA